MDSKMMTTSLDTSCRDHHQKQQRPKHAELGVFEAEKYYKMEIDSRGLDLDLNLGKPIVYSMVDDRKNVEIDDDPRPKGGSCPKSRENASFSCLLRGLCSNEPKAATGDHKRSVRLIRTTTTKYSCPDRIRSDQIIMPKACPPASPNRPLKVSDKTNPNQIRDRADIEASLDKRLAVLTWDAIPGARKMPLVRKFDGYESDVSSELFEIENLSVSTRQLASTIMPRISVARRGSAGGLFMGCSGQKSTAVCETASFMKPKYG